MSKILCNLSNLRKQRSLRQTDLSKLTGISQKALSELETGKSKGVSFSTLTKLCDALRVSIDQLFEVIPDENSFAPAIRLIEKPSCSFCTKNETEVELLVVGKGTSKHPVYICSECIERCNSLLEEERVTHARRY
ncbi:MAG TPA: helix-turn-helix domain-containing protein [Candidatus Obscuribacterales bacterium]